MASPALAMDDSVQEQIENEASWEREQEAVEDPLAQQQLEKFEHPVLRALMPDTFEFYGSLRYRHRQTAEASFAGDAGSRAGIDGEYQFIENYWVLGRAEYGFNFFDSLDLVFDHDGRSNNTFREDVFIRLGYIALETPNAFLIYGKNWSTYYQVASFTDRFQGAGGAASGIYSGGTDGGPSGTGRADNVLQTRIQIEHPWGPLSVFKPFTLNLQAQAGEKIPYAEDTRYDYSLGFSFILERKDNIKTGVAVNYAAIREEDLPRLRPLGIDGDDVAVLLGVQWFGPKWYAATTLSWLKNHMASSDGFYVDAWGSEGYGHYQLAQRWWLVGGWNYLEPLAGERETDYVLRYGVLGVRYTFKDFQRMIYANIRFDKSRPSHSEGEEMSNTYTIGLKWDFDWSL